jgi:branched-chain amino acid transport system substrate-binding protein
VLLSATNGDYSLTLSSAYRAGFYRVAPSDTMEATAVAYYAITKQSRTSVKIIHDQDTFRTELANTYSRSFGAMGGRVLGFYPVNSSIFNLDSLLTALYATEIPSLYYVALPNKTATSVFGALYSKTYYAPLAGASSLLDSGFASSVNSVAAEGMILARLRPAGKDASPYGYDTMNLLFAAIDKAAVLDSDGTLYIGKSALRNALASLSLNGQTGLLLCNKYGDCAHPIFDIYMFKGTDFTAIDQVTIPSSFGIGAVMRGE